MNKHLSVLQYCPELFEVFINSYASKLIPMRFFCCSKVLLLLESDGKSLESLLEKILLHNAYIPIEDSNGAVGAELCQLINRSCLKLEKNANELEILIRLLKIIPEGFVGNDEISNGIIQATRVQR